MQWTLTPANAHIQSDANNGKPTSEGHANSCEGKSTGRPQGFGDVGQRVPAVAYHSSHRGYFG
eukprot:8649724-Lingulodinium_polyedra.AAC.1